MTRLFILTLFFFYAALSVHSFVSLSTKDYSSLYPGFRIKTTASDNDDAITSSKAMFQSDSWKPIKASLDKVPIFTCGNARGLPIAYDIETKDGPYKVPFFFCDVDDAQCELEKWKAKSLEEAISIIPFPMGKVFEMWATNQAIMVPHQEAIVQAGAAPDTNPIGQQVPLFACWDIMQDDGTGSEVVPFYLVLEEAQAAVAQAAETEGSNVEDFDVVSLPLSRAVKLLASVSDTPVFRFIPPQKSVEFIKSQQADNN